MSISTARKKESEGKVHFISFQIFKEGGPSVSADFQGALRLHYNIILIKKKKPNYKNLVTKSQYTNFFIKYYIYRLKD